MQQSETPSGLLLIDKPAGISSFDIIRSLRRQTSIKKMGHAGTLDPAATGLMLILIGKATKQATTLSKLDKTYVAEMVLGSTSTTGDREGKVTLVSDRQPTSQELTAAMTSLTGEITQTPSAFSAIKVNGVRAYKLAREGQAVAMPSRHVTVHRLELLKYNYPKATFEAAVSSGTYIRTIGEDIGKALGTGAYLSDLRRTMVGEYGIENAQPLDAISGKNLAEHLIQI